MRLRDERTFLSAALALGLILVYAGARAVTGATRHPEVTGRRFWALKALGESQADLVLVGDSRVYRGLDPAPIAAATGWRVLNLGYSNGSLSRRMCQEAERRLDPGGRRCVLLGITPNVFTPDAAKDTQFREVRTRGRLEVAFDTSPVSWLAGPLEPLSLLDLSARLRGLPRTTYHQEFHDDGFVASWTEPADESSGLASYRKRFERHRASPRVTDELLTQVAAWTSSGVRVVGMRLPVSAAMKALEDAKSGFDEAGFRARFAAAGGRWLDPELTYRTYDGSHLFAAEARRLSRWVGEQLKARE